MTKNTTLSQFVKKAKEIHGNKYDYSLVEYVNNKTKIKIICSEHGIFEQKPANHVCLKQGCRKCFDKKQSIKKRKNIKDFTVEAKRIHKNKYDYSLVDYNGDKAKIKIICKIHGMFEQMAGSHLTGKGCAGCSKNKRYSNKEFIEKAIKTHNNKYDYSLVNYINSSTKIKIICRKHKVFMQRPGEHLSGKGCKKCGVEKRGNALLLSLNEFINKANKIHNNKYDYSLAKYVNSRTKIKIICPKHNMFEQIPNSHLNGHGCPICKNSKGEKKIIEFLEKNNVEFERQKTFNDCKNILKLRFDFYLPSKNILIEYDGKQHFGLGWSKYKENFKSVKKNDKIKNKFAKKNNIKLIRIPYTKLNKIEDILVMVV